MLSLLAQIAPGNLRGQPPECTNREHLRHNGASERSAAKGCSHDLRRLNVFHSVA
jgi:hypothetical protein